MRRRVGIAWGLLVLNALTYYGSILHIPSAVGKLVTQGALTVALLVALTVNRRVVVRPNIFLCLVSLLAVEALITTLQPQHVGTVYRCFRSLNSSPYSGCSRRGGGGRDLLLSPLLPDIARSRARHGDSGRAGGAWPVPSAGAGSTAYSTTFRPQKSRTTRRSRPG